MIPANTTVTCPSCDGEFEVEYDMQEDEIIDCENCDAELQLKNGDLVAVDEDIYEDDEDDEEDDTEQNPNVPIAGTKYPGYSK